MTKKNMNSLSDMDLSLLVEMNAKAQRLVELMKKGIVEFIYTKSSTGKERKAHGTLDPKLIPASDRRKPGRPRKRPDYLVVYFDTDKQEVRSFKDFLLKKYKKEAVQPDTKAEENSNDED